MKVFFAKMKNMGLCLFINGNEKLLAFITLHKCLIKEEQELGISVLAEQKHNLVVGLVLSLNYRLAELL